MRVFCLFFSFWQLSRVGCLGRGEVQRARGRGGAISAILTSPPTGHSPLLLEGSSARRWSEGTRGVGGRQSCTLEVVGETVVLICCTTAHFTGNRDLVLAALFPLSKSSVGKPKSNL